MSSVDFRHLLNQYNQSIKDCRNVYLSSAQTICDSYHPLLGGMDTGEFLQAMDELHRGLLVKLFVTIAGVDQVWTRSEELMAGVLVFHLWQQQLTDKQVRETIRQFAVQSASLKWETLVQPFKTMSPLHDRIGEIETVVIRIGNILAKSDGNPTSLELGELKKVQRTILTYLLTSDSMPTDPQSNSTTNPKRSLKQAQQIATWSHDTGEVEPPCDLSDDGLNYDLPDKALEPTAAQEQQETLDIARDDLDRLVGLESVKAEVQTLINFLKLQQRREQSGLPVTKISLHMTFCGNPGTGKTTVARILGKIYGAMGVLKKGHLVETDRSGLVAEFAGQTAPKTNKLIDSALDGVLFIDEAYSLLSESGDDPFGAEAVQTLLKRMEDDRDRLIVILAGYPDKMERLLKSNPGLSSRFSRNVFFDDYSPVQLGQIFWLMCQTNHYDIRKVAHAKTIAGFEWIHRRRDEHFGNGRFVRNIFEKAVRNLANRIVEIDELTENLLTRFEFEDLEFEGVPPETLVHRNLAQQKYTVKCSNCDASSDVSVDVLGGNVRCNRCTHRFIACWGKPAKG